MHRHLIPFTLLAALLFFFSPFEIKLAVVSSQFDGYEDDFGGYYGDTVDDSASYEAPAYPTYNEPSVDTHSAQEVFADIDRSGYEGPYAPEYYETGYDYNTGYDFGTTEYPGSGYIPGSSYESSYGTADDFVNYDSVGYGYEEPSNNPWQDARREEDSSWWGDAWGEVKDTAGDFWSDVWGEPDEPPPLPTADHLDDTIVSSEKDASDPQQELETLRSLCEGVGEGYCEQAQALSDKLEGKPVDASREEKPAVVTTSGREEELGDTKTGPNAEDLRDIRTIEKLSGAIRLLEEQREENRKRGADVSFYDKTIPLLQERQAERFRSRPEYKPDFTYKFQWENPSGFESGFTVGSRNSTPAETPRSFPPVADKTLPDYSYQAEPERDTAARNSPPPSYDPISGNYYDPETGKVFRNDAGSVRTDARGQTEVRTKSGETLAIRTKSKDDSEDVTKLISEADPKVVAEVTRRLKEIDERQAKAAQQQNAGEVATYQSSWFERNVTEPVGGFFSWLFGASPSQSTQAPSPTPKTDYEQRGYIYDSVGQTWYDPRTGKAVDSSTIQGQADVSQQTAPEPMSEQNKIKYLQYLSDKYKKDPRSLTEQELRIFKGL